MGARVYGATREEIPEVRAVLHDTFEKNREESARQRFYIVYDVCDPDFQPEQYRFRRMRGQIVSALKVYVRTLHHPDGPVRVTVIGGVCTREKLRGRGLLRPVIRDSLEYSRSLGARAELIVTPRRDYYLRHGFTYVTTHNHHGRTPDLPAKDVRFEPLAEEDAGWMADMFHAAARGYGPIVRTETYVRKWILGARLGYIDMVGVKMIRRGRPVAYGIFSFREKPMQVAEVVSKRGHGSDEAALVGWCRHLGAERFVAHFPAQHPLVAFLNAGGRRLRAEPVEQYMYHALDPSFPIPGESFHYSRLDYV